MDKNISEVSKDSIIDLLFSVRCFFLFCSWIIIFIMEKDFYPAFILNASETLAESIHWRQAERQREREMKQSNRCNVVHYCLIAFIASNVVWLIIVAVETATFKRYKTLTLAPSHHRKNVDFRQCSCVYFTGNIRHIFRLFINFSQFLVDIFTYNLFISFSLDFVAVVSFSGLVDCDYYKTDEYQYSQFVDLSNVKDAQPTGYYARVPVYLIGPRDAHIILSPNSTVDRDHDFIYEFCKCFPPILTGFAPYFTCIFISISSTNDLSFVK